MVLLRSIAIYILWKVDEGCSCRGCELSVGYRGGFLLWGVGIRAQYIVGGVKCYSAGMNRGVGRTERGKDGAIIL